MIKINNLQDLASSLPTECEKVYSCKPNPETAVLTDPGNYRAGIQLWDTSTIDYDTFVTKVACNYLNAIEYQQRLIGNTLRHLYKKRIVFREGITSDVRIKVKEVINYAQKDMKDIARDFRNHMGYHASFFRKEHGEYIPIESRRIMQAYDAVRRRAPVRIIEKILYSS